MLKSWSIAVLGLVALAVLAWVAGPLLMIGGQVPLASPQARVILVVAFTLQYLGQKLWQSWRARHDNECVLNALTRSAESGPSAESARLRERFACALRELRRARFRTRGGFWSAWKFSRSYFYQLPWYLILGAPGAGKTTVLMNSGLSFPLAETLGRGAVEGAGSTRNCDWWFTEQAVLIDTAGRYTTHESDGAADRQAWGGLLELLRQARPRRPLNGVLVVVAVSELLELSADGIVEHGRVLRARLDELQMALRVRLPVYFLLTKCDLIPGFVDWFGAFEVKDRDQIWGVTFDLRSSDTAQAGAQFAAEFERLVNRLTDGMPDRLQAERDAQRRGRMFSLPRQLRAIGGPLDSLVRRVFGPSPAAAAASGPCLRGVYLTSGTQQGTPIDRMLSGFGRELGLRSQILPSNQNTGKSYFLTRLLNDVVFVETELSGRNPLRRRAQRRLRLSLIVAMQLCAIAVATWWVGAYLRTVDEMARLERQVTGVREIVEAIPTRAGPDPRALLPALNAVGALEHTAQAARATELVDLGAGSRRKLAVAARQAYDRILLGPFQRRIGKAIDVSLRSGVDVNLQYEALKAYTMLRDPEHFDAQGFKIFVTSYWDSALSPPLTSLERGQLGEHLDALVDAGAVESGITIEPALVESVRSRLRAQSPAERIGLRVATVLAGHPHEDFTVASLGPTPGGLFVGADRRSAPRSVPGRYTTEAYHDVVQAEVPAIAAQLVSEADWVLGQSVSDDGAVVAEFRATYGKAYAQAWADLIDDLHLKPATTTEEMIEQARALGALDGPLAHLLTIIVEQTSLGLATDTDGPIASTDPLAARFIALQRLGTAGSGSALDVALRPFRELATLREVDGPSADSVLAHIVANAGREPEPVRSLVLALATTWARPPVQPSAASPATLSRQVAAHVGASCLRLVAGRYPFDRAAQRDASLEEFALLFAPRGAFDETFSKVIAEHVDTSTDNWQPLGTGAAPDPQELDRFRAAARIREVFFPHGDKQPSIQLTFRPLDMDPGIERFQIEVDGQFVRYERGLTTATIIKWPGAQGSARIDVTPTTEDPLEFSGPWAIFRLLDHAAVQAGELPGRFRVIFNVGGRRVRFEVESSSGTDPFRFRELEQFSCPIAES